MQTQFFAYLKFFLQITEEGNVTQLQYSFAWKIPWMKEPSRLQSMGSLRVRHDWATSFSLFIFVHWRRKWQPTPVFLPGESQGTLVGCHLRGCTVRHNWSDLAPAAAADNYMSKKFLLPRKCEIYTEINPWRMGQSPKRRVDSHPIPGRDILKYKMRLRDAPPNDKPVFK